MYRNLVSFCVGLYMGTFYDCKPIMNKIISKIKETIPEKELQDENNQRNKSA